MVKLANIFNSDGWVNLLTNLGAKKDRTTNTSHFGGTVLRQQELEDLYRFTGFARKVIDLPAYEMTREWVCIENDTDNAGEKELARLNAKTVLRDSLKWGNLFGGAIVVMLIDDGGMLDTPVNERGIRRVESLRVYDRWQVTWTTADVNTDPESVFFGEVEYYTVQAYTTAQQFRVHASRVLRFDGADVPEVTRARNQGWGDSVLQAVYDELRDYGIVKQSVVGICEDFVQTILSIDNLTHMIANGQESVIQKRMELIDMSRSVNNTILLDGEEKYTKQASTVTGLDKLIIQFAVALSGVTGIPMTKLFGQSPAGLNATGESDIRNFYDEIKSKQEEILLPMLDRLLLYIMLSRDGGYKGTINKDAKITFNPLWQLTDTQDADWKKKIAETDKIYIDSGVLSPEEVTVSRFSKGFNPDTEIDLASRPLPVDDDEPAQQ